MNKFLRQFITEWRKLDLPMKDETLIVAVSGGADSVSLLLALAELKQKKKLELEFVIGHFNHDLRGKESERDEKFVCSLAETLEFSFESVKWRVKKSHKNSGENLEQAARLARYEFLGRLAEESGAYGILTGHTMDDQAETFLLRLIRGSGIDGLGAMKPVRKLKDKNEALLIRPMLNWARRSDTEDFCRAGKIKYREDAMNRDESFLRVKVRKRVLPLLQTMNPKIVENLAKMSGILQEEIVELEVIAQAALNNALGANKDTVDVKALQRMSPAKLKRALRLWLSSLRGGLRRLDMEHFAALERLISSGTGGKTVELPGGETVVLSKVKLIFRKTKVEKSRTGI